MLAGYTTAYLDNPETAAMKEFCATRLRQLTSAAKPYPLTADEFTAVHEDDNCECWYREAIGESGYPDGVLVASKFRNSTLRPSGTTVLSLRSVSNLQIRGQAFIIPHGRYRVQWHVWMWAGKTYPSGGGPSVPVAPFTENSVVEHMFPSKDPEQDSSGNHHAFAIPCDTRFSAGRAKRPRDGFAYDEVDVHQTPIQAEALLEPGFKEYKLEYGLWNTY